MNTFTNSILLVGGNWDLKDGKKSKIVELFSKELPNATVFNGGYYFDLKKIVERCRYFDIVLWWANVPNELPKLRNVKDINHKAMFVSSKRNNGDYSFDDLLQRALEVKADLTMEFTKKKKTYSMRLFDPLGNLWYEGTSVKKCAKRMLERLSVLLAMTRKPTVASNETIDIPEDVYDNDFINIIRDYATVFAKAIFDTKDVNKFLGNASFRCTKEIPSFKYGDLIFVSKRNVNEEFISAEDFIPVYTKEGKIYYIGENKPSVDTPVQAMLYKELPNINYMIHSHCYIENAPFTKECIPCGAIEEVQEILDALKENYNNDLTKAFYVLNLKGHGSIMMGSDSKELTDISIVGRPLPEKQEHTS